MSLKRDICLTDMDNSMRYQRGNQNPYIEEQTTQWPKEKVQKHKQRSTKRTYKAKDLVTSYILYAMNNHVWIKSSFARKNKKLVGATKIKKRLKIPKGLYAFVS